MKTRAAALAALLLLAGCHKADQAASAPASPFAGLDGEILKWRGDIMKTDKLCQSHVEGQACEGFEVVCKAQREITPAETAKGVNAKVVVAMTWTGFDTARHQGQLGGLAAQFAKANGAWTRTSHAPVNPGTCADLAS